MDFNGRVGGPRRSGGRDVDEFGRERRSRPHQRKPYDRPQRGRRGNHNISDSTANMGSGMLGGEAKDIESRLSSLIVKVGDKNTPALQNNLDALSVVLEKDFAKHEVTVLRTFRQCILELPWKVTVYSTLAGLLNAKNSETGEKIVKLMHGVLCKKLAEGQWTSVKILMRFFALLVSTNTISAPTLVSMIDVFIKPVQESDGAVSANNNCYVFVVMSTLLWAGHSLQEHAPEELEQRLGVIAKYVQQHSEQTANNSITTIFHDAAPKGINVLAYLYDVLQSVATNEQWKIDAIFAPYELFANEFSQAKQHELPEEPLLELLNTTPISSFHTPSEFLQLVPSPLEHFVRRYILQDFMADGMTQLEGNRKDCGKYLLQIHELCGEDVCTVMAASETPENVDPENTLVFEYMLAEVLMSSLLQLPEGQYQEMYYTSLAVELRKAEPEIMANVLEALIENVVMRIKSVDVECINRLSNWLAVYISNFGFDWDWNKWENVANEDEDSPRRCFVQETLLKLIRLSYLDRIKSIVPESFTVLIPSRAPTHNFKFTIQAMDDRTREVSIALGKCLKSKGTVDQALAILQEHYSQWTDIDDDARQSLAREMLIEHILLLGSKTFSHMLNAIEKFMPALQKYGDSPEAKLQIAKVAEDFWVKNPQFFAITIDKLMNYRVIDPSTVISMLFDAEHRGSWHKFYLWEILTNTVSKVNMRVEQLQTRLEAAQQAASNEMADEVSEDVEHVESTLAQMVQEQKDVIVSTIRSFVQLLSSDGCTSGELDRAWLLGRFKEFLRRYRVQVLENVETLEAQVFTDEASDDTRQAMASIRRLLA